MRVSLGLEDAALAALGVAGWQFSGWPWWLLAALFLAPDISIAAYLAGPRVGAAVYNVAHHRALAVAMWALGIVAALPPLIAVGALLFAHASFDRIFGFGLKYATAFGDTHLGAIGDQARTEPPERP